VPFRRHAKREVKEELNILMQKGFSRLYISGKEGGQVLRIEELLEEKKPAVNESTFVLIDRVVAKDFDEDDKHRIADSVQTAFYESEGDCMLELDGSRQQHFSNRFELDGIQFEEPVPNLFSFNNPYGACPVCEGFGQVLGIDPDLVIPDKRLSVYEGAIAPWRGEKMGEYKETLIKASRKFNFPIHKPITELSDEQLKLLWTGNEHFYGINEFFKMVEQNLYKVQYRVLQARYRGRTICPECGGGRLRKEALYVKIGGKSIADLVDMPVTDLKAWFDALQLSEYDQQVAKRILIEVHHRIKTLLDVGLGYLTMNRVANTLSGGESQRIQLTRSLGSNLTNSLYILDEPSIGLHARDTHRLIGVLKELRNLGNTVVVVEHDEQMMQEADYIIDMGPLASHLGGEVIFAGDYPTMLKDPNSLTGKYLSGQLTIEPPTHVRKWKKAISLEGCRQHNLKNISVDFPLQVLCVVSGVSGSGKTTLVKQILYPALMKLKGEFAERVGQHRALKGAVDDITQIEMVDQNPIGKSSRSNPVTYIKAYDEIRDLFSKQPLSKMRGFQAKHFSFNVDGGRCDACKGEGEVIVEMQFLADVHLTCESCGGKRFKDEVLEVAYKGKNIYDVLEMSVDEALDFFKDEKDVCNKIRPLSDVGLGYVKLGQSSDTLSGGEAQRVKLASFLGKGRAQGHILFIFDEPTTGLHFHDIKKLLNSFNALIEQGHTVLVIEHNLDVIRSADWVIDLGPEGGAGGGNLLYAGVPAGLKKVKESYTGKYL
jgi:excinuclease ABC subunit A